VAEQTVAHAHPAHRRTQNHAIAAEPAPAKTRTSIAKVVGASLIGTTIEWYDFFLYGVAAALVFGDLFFPSFDPLVGTPLAFATYAVGFLARPVGGLVFGHFGDRLGRKKMLVITLLMMGGATALIGILPTYVSVGAAAPILLVMLRCIQGFALGGEWGGAVLMSAEHGGDDRRGLWTIVPQAGAPAGNLLAVGVLALLSAVMSGETFDAWGWRIPFLLSGVLVLVGLWIRNSVAESPVFEAARTQAEHSRASTARLPALEVVARYRREVLIAMGARFAENVSYYVFTVFILTYATEQLDLPRSFALTAVLAGSALHLLAIPLFGALSDRIGRRPVYTVGAVGVGAWSFAFFRLLDTRSWTLFAVAAMVGLLFHAAMYGPQGAFFSELFGTGVRYTGASIGYQLASVFAGSLAPIIAVALLSRYGSSLPISLYMLGTAVITIVARSASPETARSDLTQVGASAKARPVTGEDPIAGLSAAS
jgi:metabolite-proton symporter